MANERKSGSCIVLVPFHSRIHTQCEDGLTQLERAGLTVWRRPGASSVDLVRSEMASEALDHGYDRLFWIDADIGFDRESAFALLKHELPIISGIYVKKGLRELACHELPGNGDLTFGKEGSVREVLFNGFGFMAIYAAVFDKLKEELKLPICNEAFGKSVTPFFLPMVAEYQGANWYLAEDFAFCHRARQCGFRILADTTIRLYHIGDYGFTWEDAGAARQRYESYIFRRQ